jgi:hypothetical protein
LQRVHCSVTFALPNRRKPVSEGKGEKRGITLLVEETTIDYQRDTARVVDWGFNQNVL